ncbi:hypothetical protein MTO96_038497, partial [Rhipicephalus appendiculatus]
PELPLPPYELLQQCPSPPPTAHPEVTPSQYAGASGEPPLFAVVGSEVHLGKGVYISEEKWAWLLSRPKDSLFCKEATKLLWGVSALRNRSLTGAPCRRFARQEDPAPSRRALTPLKLQAVANGRLLSVLRFVVSVYERCALYGRVHIPMAGGASKEPVDLEARHLQGARGVCSLRTWISMTHVLVKWLTEESWDVYPVRAIQTTNVAFGLLSEEGIIKKLRRRLVMVDWEPSQQPAEAKLLDFGSQNAMEHKRARLAKAATANSRSADAPAENHGDWDPVAETEDLATGGQTAHGLLSGGWLRSGQVLGKIEGLPNFLKLSPTIPAISRSGCGVARRRGPALRALGE